MSFVISVPLEAQWVLEGTVINTLGIFKYISVADSGVVWVLGENWYSGANFIARRSPNGLWDSIPANGINNSQPLGCIAGKDFQTAWAGSGYSSVTGNSYLYMTTNGGQNWFVQINLSGTHGYFNDIRFSRKNPSYGYAWSDPPLGNGTPFKIYKTTNNGINWIEYSVTLDTHYVGASNSISVTDSAHAWFGLCKNIPGGDYYGKILYTTNGGANFDVLSLPLTGTFVCSTEFKFDNNFGFAAILEQPHYYVKTTNGGFSWQAVYVSSNFQVATRIISIPNTDVWYISTNEMGPDNRIFKTTNNGSSWLSMATPNQQFIVIHMDAVLVNNIVYAYALSAGGEVLRLVDTVSLIGIKNLSGEIPKDFSLSQNYPNPFNPVTTIKFSVPKQSHVKLIIYDLLGREVVTLVNELRNPGYYEIPFDAVNYASGVYFYRMVSDDFADVKKMVVMK